MKIFKTLTVTAFFAFFSLGCLSAQDLSEAVELYNGAIKAFQESQYTQAISDIEKALQIATAVEDDEQALDIKANCEKIIPQFYFSYAKQQIKDKEYAEALQILNKTMGLAEKYNDDEVLISAEDLTPQVYIAKGSVDVEAGNIEEGIAAYRTALELDKNNSTIYLRIAMAQRANDEAGALTSFDQLIAMEGAKPDDVATAKKQASNIYLKRAAAAQPAKKWNEMYENAQKAAGYDNSNTQTFKLLGMSAIELKKWKDAISAYEAVLSAEPNAKDKNTTIYRLGMAYENSNNKAKACGFYKQIVGDAQFKAFAEQKVKELCQ
ncbi:MAG: tetratricopeptide repeat protein [Prevotellaceae bacterium]|jgi:tetratricopeptide (TPR) repeat protein|nr:tetratricopeptide repeat protein [Prevotellaceae bacterium]